MKTSTISPTCPYCHKPVTEAHDAVMCPICRSTHHRTCWQHGDGCQAEGCIKTDITPLEVQGEEAPPPTNVPVQKKSFLPWFIGGGIIVLLVLAALLAVSLGANPKTVLVIAVVVAALAFDYVNGMHDAGNAIATVISTRVLTPVAALAMAAVLNLLGALVHAGVAASIATKFAAPTVDPTTITPIMILCGLIGASIWSFATARIGIPVSTSHSLFGGLIGVFLLGGVKLNAEYIEKLGLWMVLAPLMAFTVGWALMVLLMWIFRKMSPHKINRHFRVWQLFSSALMAFSHGSNDAQKAMGIITMALLSGGFIHFAAGAPVVIPIWVKVACAMVIAVGTGIGGMRVIRTLGHKIIKLDPIHGFTAETVAATTIQIVTFLKIPISTTHIISSSILGIGASKRLSAVRWGVAINIVMAWVFTIPACVLSGALLYSFVKLFGLH